MLQIDVEISRKGTLFTK